MVVKNMLIPLVLAGLPFLAATAQAQDVTKIDHGITAMIEKHGTCRIVTNNNGVSAMVPHKTTSEWNIGPKAFLAEARAGLNVEPYGRINPVMSWSKVLDVCSDVYTMVNSPLT